MSITVSTTKENLRKIFDKVNRVYYFPDTTKALAEQTGGIEFPVLESGVTFNTGDPEKNDVKLTDGTTWTSKISQGDSDISFQVSSVHETITNLLMTKKTNSSVTAEFDGVNYTGNGYALAPKKVSGALLMTSEDKTTAIYLPNAELIASFNGEGGDDSTGYFNVAITPLSDASGADIYILSGVASSSSD